MKTVSIHLRRSIKIYRVFISHAWKYNDEYYRLVEILNNALNFKWCNHSDPKHDPLVDLCTPVGKQKMIQMLKNQIQGVNCVLVISGMYAAYREWIQKEIDISNDFYKPVIGIIPRGQERIPIEVQAIAKDMVRWNTDSIISAIRMYSI